MSELDEGSASGDRSADDSPVASDAGSASAAETMRMIDVQLRHVWMVRTFLKHCDEATEDEELRDIHRELYDYMLALGGPFQSSDVGQYLKLARKKFSKLKQAALLFAEIQPEVSTHTNFVMAAASLLGAVSEIERLLSAVSSRGASGASPSV